MDENTIIKKTRSASADENEICNLLMGTEPLEGFNWRESNVEASNNLMKGDKHIAAATNLRSNTQRTSQDGWALLVTLDHYSNAELDAFIACCSPILQDKQRKSTLLNEPQQHLNMDVCTQSECDHCVREPERRIIRQGSSNTEPLPPPRTFKRRFVVLDPTGRRTLSRPIMSD
jgi:hypothetical protein